MRVKASFNSETKEFVKSGKKQAVAILEADRVMTRQCEEKDLSSKPMLVRLLRVKTHKGDYILITNLVKKALTQWLRLRSFTTFVGK